MIQAPPDLLSVIPPLVLFDLDGTLLDSAPDLLSAINALLIEESRVPVSLEGFRRMVSRGGLAMLAHGFPDLDESAHAARLPRFLDHYARAATCLSQPFDGVERVLDQIEVVGSRWGVVTNKPGRLAGLVLDGMGWRSRCSVLVSGDTLAAKKPDPAPLLFACDQLDIAVSDSVYVGDDERDIQAARAAGMRSVAVCWGYRADHEDPEGWGGDVVVDHPEQLLTPGVLMPR